ncbi:hypothetical protein [Mucilaginibacter sp.]|uniref:hypothetical protein n=1 Tax=Mucilaginibacter sp. TaxID=1882438 RepID=UPI0025EFC619|nr:hypothetical protein [Mucilaginibacter sp.]
MMKNLKGALKVSGFLISIWFCPGFTAGYAQAHKKLPPDVTDPCGCPVMIYTKSPPPNYTPLSGHISYAEFQKFNQWKLPNGVTTFNSLSATGESYTGHGDDFFERLNIISSSGPIKLVHPAGTFSLNLTPCADQYHSYVLPVSVGCKPSFAGEIRDFDFTKFENTSLGYVHLYFRMAWVSPYKMIRSAFKQWAQNYELNGVNGAITKINLAYNTRIPLTTEKNYADSLMISAVIDSVVSKKLNPEQVFNTGFVLSEPGVHSPTYDEKYHIEILFQPYAPYRAAELFNIRKFLPDYTVELETRQALVEISSKILSPAIRSKEGQAPYTNINIEMCSAFFNNESMIRIDCESDACLPSSVITGTNITVDFDHAFLYSEQLNTMPGWDCVPYEEFARDTNAYKAYPPKKWELYDTLFTHFTGLVIRNATFRMPYGKTRLVFKGHDVIINNRVIAGHLDIDLDLKTKAKPFYKRPTEGHVSSTYLNY